MEFFFLCWDMFFMLNFALFLLLLGTAWQGLSFFSFWEPDVGRALHAMRDARCGMCQQA